MRRAFALLGLSATLLVAWMALLPSRASARVTGPCTTSIDGVEVTDGHDSPDTAVPLQSGTQVPVAGTAEARVTTLSYTVHVAGGGIQVGSVVISEDGRSWSGTVDLADFSTATVGLFEVTAEVDTQGGDCTGVAYVCIEGRSPFTTAAGAGATALGVGGGILLALSLARGGGMGATRSAVQGFVGGATAGLGGAVLLQQFCTLPLTAASAAGIPIAIGAAGAVGASLVRRAGTRGARRPARRVPTGGEPTQAVERGTELRAGDPGAGGRELAGAGPGVSGGGGPSASGSSGGGGSGGPGGPAPSGPAGGSGAGGPAPSGPAGAAATGGPAPSGPAGGAPGGPAPSRPGGAAIPPAEITPPGAPIPDTGMVLPPIPPAPIDERDCPNCGAENSPDSLFCTSCGTSLRT